MSDFICSSHLKNSKHIWQRHKGLVISSWPFLLLIANSMKIKLNFQRIYDNTLSKLFHFQKNFLDARNFLTIFPAIYQSSSMHSGLALQLQIRSFLVRTLLMYRAGHEEPISFQVFQGSYWSTSSNDWHQISKTDFLSVQWPKIGFGRAKWVIKNDK